MSADPIDAAEKGRPSTLFTTTHWSVVLAAGDKESGQGSEALEKLCRLYWYPLYAFVRRQGHEVEEPRGLYSRN